MIIMKLLLIGGVHRTPPIMPTVISVYIKGC